MRMTNQFEILPADLNLTFAILPHCFTAPHPLLRPHLSLISLAIAIGFLITISI